MIALLIPVLGRAHQIKPLLESIERSTTTEHRVVLIFSPGDTGIRTARGTDAVVLKTTWPAGRADYAKKLQLGFENTDEPWLFQGATDLLFQPEWDTRALRTQKRTRALVIGTNDLGNPLVKRGKHSTHSLFAREYITHWGGVADGSGLIFSEAYDHQWSDSEFIETATQRRVFAFARDSHVEHLHPHWNKAEMDATYEKAHLHTKDDMKIFTRRRAIVTRAIQLEKRHKKSSRL